MRFGTLLPPLMALIFAPCAVINDGIKTLMLPEVHPEVPVPIKIRVYYNEDDGVVELEHAYVVVGNYEFDMTDMNARRFDLDDALDPSDKQKAQPFKFGGLYTTPAKAETVFFAMSERFWFEESFNVYYANCLNYVVNFVHALLANDEGGGGGTTAVPTKEMWPNNFIELDNYFMLDAKNCGIAMPVSALDCPLINLPKLPVRNDPDQNCTLKSHALKLTIINRGVNKRLKTSSSDDDDDDYDDDDRTNADKDNTNFVLVYLTGRFHGNVRRSTDFKDRIHVETVPEKMSKSGKMVVRLQFVLKAYSCKMWREHGIGGHTTTTKAFVTNFLLMNETRTKYIVPKRVRNIRYYNMLTNAMDLAELTDYGHHGVSIEYDEWAQIR